MILYKTAFKVSLFWLAITLCWVLILAILHIGLAILGIETIESFFKDVSDFYVTGNLASIAAWRIHLFIIFLGTILSILNKAFPDEDFDTYS